MQEYIKEFIKPELLIVIPVCYFVGSALVKSEKVKNEYIPFILGATGIALSVLYVFATCNIIDAKSVLMALFIALTQGVLTSGVSVYIDQLVKQKENIKNEKLNTDIEK